MLKRSVSLVLALLLIVSMMVGCGQANQTAATPGAGESAAPSASASESATPSASASESTAPAAPVTLKYIQNSANNGNEDTLKQMIEGFEGKNPNIKIDYEIIPWADYYTKLNIVLSSGEDIPDVFEVGYENFAQYAKNDQLMALDDIIAKDTAYKTDTIKKSVFDAYKFNGKQLGVPTDNNGCIMYYNKDLFDSKGVAYPTPEWTWQDELAAAQKLTDASQGIWGTISPVQIYEFYKTAAQNGGSFWDGKTCTINNKANVDALTWMIEKTTKYNVTPPLTSDIMTTSDADTNVFIAGKVAMLRGGIWQIPRFSQECTFKWDVIVEPGNVAKAHNSFVNGLVVSKSSKNGDAAWQFMKYMATDKDCVAIRIQKGWNIPVINDESVMAAYYSVTPPDSRKYIAAINDSSVMPPLGPIPEKWGDIQTIVNEEIEKAKLGNLTPQAAMDEAKERLEKLVN